MGVLLIAGILGATVSYGVLPSTTFQLQSSRDQLVTAFFAAQQRAMAQTNVVRLVVSSPNQIDVRENAGGIESSISIGGTQYPVSLQSNQTLTPTSFTFDRLGKTNPSVITLSQGSASVAITVSATGYIF